MHGTSATRLTRRGLLADVGRATIGVIFLGATACTGEGSGREGAGSAPAGPLGTASPDRSPAAPTAANADPSRAGLLRVDLGFVSAYIVARAGEAAVVDTGVAGSGNGIDAVLQAAGLAWDAVGHVILTHRHPDHVGGLGEVLDLAADAAVYAGEADIPAIASSREVTAVADGEDVFGLRIIATPGHTPGHISLHDAEQSILIAGDALVGGGSGVEGPDPQFTSDLDTAHESVRKLGELRFDTLVFGHGEPVEPAADAQVKALADDL